MKKYAWFCFIALGAICCKNSGVDKKEEGLKYKETVTINDVPKASLTFFEVEDSRCPEGAQCIWAGNATVDLLLSGVTVEGGVNEHIKLCTGTCGIPFGNDTLIKKFAGEEYRIILIDVRPYPNLAVERKKEDYNILLKIERQ